MAWTCSAIDARAAASTWLGSWSRQTAGNAEYLTLTFKRNLAATNLTHAVEVSGDLENWTPGLSYGAALAPAGATLLTEVSRVGTNIETIVVRDKTPIGVAPARFLRLRVTAP